MTLPALPDLTPTQARQQLALPASTFWRLVRREKVEQLRYGPRCVRFPAAAIAELRARRVVRGAEDMSKLTDGRRR